MNVGICSFFRASKLTNGLRREQACLFPTERNEELRWFNSSVQLSIRHKKPKQKQELQLIGGGEEAEVVIFN